MPISVRIDKRGDDFKFLTDRQLRRVERKAINVFIKTLKPVSREIIKANIGYIGRFQTVRQKRGIATVKKSFGKVWLGDTAVQAKFKKGRWYKTKLGAGKGNFFVKGGFLMTFRSGHTGIFKRKGGKLEEQRFKLEGAEKIVDRFLPKSEYSASETLYDELNKEMDKIK